MTKKYFIRTLLILALVLILSGLYVMNFTVAGSYILDINPSVKINTNKLGKVTSIDGLNPDGESLISGYKLDDRDLDDVIEDLVDRMILKGYFGDEIDNAIMVSKDGQGQYKLGELKEKLSDYLKLRQIDGRIVTKSLDDIYDDQLLEDLDMSGARLELIERIRERDQEFSPEELKTMRVGDLIYILSKTDIDLDDIFDDWEDIGEDYTEIYEQTYFIKKGQEEDLENKTVDIDEEIVDELDDIKEGIVEEPYDDLESEKPAEIIEPVPQVESQPQTVAPQPVPAPAPKPAPAPVYNDDDDDNRWDDDWDDDGDDDWDDDDDDDDWDD